MNILKVNLGELNYTGNKEISNAVAVNTTKVTVLLTIPAFGYLAKGP